MTAKLDTFPILHTQRLDLIEIEQHHSLDVFNIFGDEKVTKYYNLLPLKNEQEALAEIDFFKQRFIAKTGIRWGIALKNKQNIIGTIGFNKFTIQHRANIGYDLQAKFWNKGYITEALEAVIDFGFNQLSINRIEAEVMQGNIGSEVVLGKLNFRNEGVLRQWMLWNNRYYDMTMFALLRSDD